MSHFADEETLALIAKLQATVQEQVGEIADHHETRERQFAIIVSLKRKNEAFKDAVCELTIYNAKLGREAKDLEHKVKVLTDALEPFSRLLQEHHERLPDSQPIYGIGDALITVGDMRKALAAVKDSIKPALICPRCKVDRFKDPCPGPLHMCPIKGEAQ